MKLTGERPIEGKTPDSLLGLHAAGYREVVRRVGEGALLDLGCGLGDGTSSFFTPDRIVHGADYDPTTAAEARTRWANDGLVVGCMDAARLAYRSDAFDWVCSSHLIEHFTDPEQHVAEIARVLRPGGTAFFITPNKPADFENPYHVYLFGPTELEGMVARHFGSVTVLGLDGDSEVKADFERRRRTARRLLALDVLDLRHKLPRSWFVALHAGARRVAYRVMGDRWSGGVTGITADAFHTTDAIDDTTLVLFAVAASPT